MKLTTRGRYAVTAMLDLALYEQQGPISLADISERQEISLSYLEQLFSRLRRGNLVKVHVALGVDIESPNRWLQFPLRILFGR